MIIICLGESSPKQGDYFKNSLSMPRNVLIQVWAKQGWKLTTQITGLLPGQQTMTPFLDLYQLSASNTKFQTT